MPHYSRNRAGRFVAALVVVLLAATSHAHRWYLTNIPNPSKIPCPTGVNCHGTGVCYGSGHVDCFNGGTNHFGGTASHMWNTRSCRGDSDHDGKTNGDELGDPCCEWSYGDTPRRTALADISHPGDRDSVTSYPSCLLDGAPSAATNLQAVAIGQNRVKLEWTPSNSECVCDHKLEVSDGSTTAVVRVKHDQIPFVLCNLDAFATNINVRVKVGNLAGDSSFTSALPITRAGTPQSVDSEACSAIQATAPVAGSKSYKEDTHYDYIALAAIAAGLALFTIALHWLRDPTSKLRNCCLHSRVGPRPRSSILDDLYGHFISLTYLQLLMSAGFIACIVLATLWWTKYSQDQIFAWGGASEIARALGHAALIPLVLVLLPVTRHSIWTRLAGISVDRDIRFHRWIGIVFVLLMLVHGIWMSVDYDNSAYGVKFILSGGEEYKAWAGTFAGIVFVIVAFMSWSVIRRRYYALFHYMHYLTIIGLLLTFIHYPLSIAFAALGLILWMVDYVLLVLDGLVRPTVVLGAVRFGSRTGTYPHELQRLSPEKRLLMQTVLRGRGVSVGPFKRSAVATGPIPDISTVLTADMSALKKDTQAGEDSTDFLHIAITVHKQYFRYHPGQYAYVWVPSISLLPHPFTIASGPNPAPNDKEDTLGEDTFTLLIKSQGTDTWTERLVNHPGWVVDPISGTRRNTFTLLCFGAFGSPTVQLTHYKHVFLCSGGIGITPHSSMFSALIKRNDLWMEMQKLLGGPREQEAKTILKRYRITPQTNVRLVWTFREAGLAEEIMLQFLDQHADLTEDQPYDPALEQQLLERRNSVEEDEELSRRMERSRSSLHYRVELANELAKEEENEKKTDTRPKLLHLPPGFAVAIHTTATAAAFQEERPPLLVTGHRQQEAVELTKLPSKRDQKAADVAPAPLPSTSNAAPASAISAPPPVPEDAPAEEEKRADFGDMRSGAYAPNSQLEPPVQAAKLKEIETALRALPLPLTPLVNYVEGRPNMREYFQDMKARARATLVTPGDTEYVAVSVCGPMALLNEVTRLAWEFSDKDVQFHVHTETFIM